MSLLDSSNTGLCHLQDHCGPKQRDWEQRPAVSVSKLSTPWVCTGKYLRAHTFFLGVVPAHTHRKRSLSAERSYRALERCEDTCTGAGGCCPPWGRPCDPLGPVLTRRAMFCTHSAGPAECNLCTLRKSVKVRSSESGLGFINLGFIWVTTLNSILPTVSSLVRVEAERGSPSLPPQAEEGVWAPGVHSCGCSGVPTLLHQGLTHSKASVSTRGV